MAQEKNFPPTLDEAPKVISNLFGEWIGEAVPRLRGHKVTWDAPHFQAMQGLLDRVTAGEIRRVYFQIPIRHGKSEHNTVAYAVYRLERDPSCRILVGSYNQKQANRFSRKIKALYLARGGQLSKDTNAVQEWETVLGGGVIAVGAGVGIASVNADIIIIDDPIGSREDAESAAERDKVWDWLSNDILGRTEPHTVVLFTMSRWHSDDPAGRLMERQRGRWNVLDLPAEAEANDPLGRADGAPLWPEQRGAQWLSEERIDLGEYGYASLLLGRPRPRDGGMFKFSAWRKLESRPKTGKLIRYWDMAGTRPKGGSHDPDWTAGVLARTLPPLRDEKGNLAGSQTSIAHVCKFRAEPGGRDALLVARAKEDLKVYGAGVVYWLEAQAGIGGEEATANLTRKLRNVGIAVFSEHASAQSKPERARPLASAVVAGDVYLEPDDEENPWHDSFRNELADAPFGKHDDQMDAAAGAYNKLNVVVDGKPSPSGYSIKGATKL